MEKNLQHGCVHNAQIAINQTSFKTSTMQNKLSAEEMLDKYIDEIPVFMNPVAYPHLLKAMEEYAAQFKQEQSQPQQSLTNRQQGWSDEVKKLREENTTLQKLLSDREKENKTSFKF